MATGLDSPPENDKQKGALFNSGTPQGVYDDEFQKIRERSLSDTDSASSPDLKTAEESAVTPTATKADKSEKEISGADDQIGDGYKHEGSSGKRKILSKLSGRQKAAGGGILGLLVGGSIAIFSIVQGPLQVVHFGQLLQRFHFSINDDFMNTRSAIMIRNMVRHTPYRTNLGFFSNKLADRFEKRMVQDVGLRSVYDGDPRSGGRFLGYEVVDSNKAREIISDFERDGTPTDKEAPSRARTPEGRPVAGQFIDLSDDKFKHRRSAITAVNKATGTGKVSSAVSARLLKKRGGVDFHPLKNVKRKKTDNFLDWRRTQKEERANRNKTGDNLTPNAAVAETRTDADGNTLPPDPDADAAAREARQVLDEVGGTDRANLKGLTGNIVSKLGGAAAAVGIMCTAKSLGSSAEDMQFQNTVGTMMRVGGGVITTGNQVMSGQDFNLEELGVIVDDLYDEETGTSWASARSIQYELGEEPTGSDLSPNVKPDHTTGKPIVFEILDNIPGLGGACAVGDFVGGLPIIKQVGDLASGAIDAALGLFGYSIEEFAFAIIQMLAGEAVNVFATGSELGNIANYGARFAANEQAIATGGRELSDEEFQTLAYESRLDQDYEFSKQSFIARVFDPYESRSLTGQVIAKTPPISKNTITAVAQMPFKMIGSIMGNIFSALTPGAFASQHTYEYGFQRYGFKLDDQRDPQYEDPFENASIIEPLLDERITTDSNGNIIRREPGLNDKYGMPCFNLKVNPQSSRTLESASEPARYSRIEENPDCQMEGKDDAEKEIFTRYRFYIADFITDLSLTCYEGFDDNACVQLGLGGAATASPPASASGDTQQLAQQILDNPNITYPLDAVSRNGSTKAALEALARGEQAPVTCTNAGVSVTDVNPNVLRFLVDLGKETRIGVNALTDKCHSRTSNHYKGLAVDFECNAVSFSIAIADPIAERYGGRRNSETCAAHRHWHYDFLGN